LGIETTNESSFKPATIAVIFLVIGLLTGLLIGLNLSSFLSSPQQDDNETSFERVEGISADDDPFLGSPNAPVTIIEFSDFECPFCKRFFDGTLQDIITNYVDTGKVKYVLRDFPLSDIHPDAEIAAEAANCANEQDKYWEFHDLLFQNQEDWISGNTTVEFKKYGSSLGLNEEQFAFCLESGKYVDEILMDMQDGLNAGVQGTPTFYINGVKVVGAQVYSVFKQVIDEELGG
jgi:protein-disulfide isomerase|tara:strand:+ start:4184 stop:4882 length:699 start_codon:yes stop_codon:yes gene_type:complete